MEKMEYNEKEVSTSYSYILPTLGKILDPNIRGEIYLGKRYINSETYEEEPIPQVNLSENAYLYDQLIKEQVEKEINEGKLTLTMFTCPNGNATDIRNNFASIIPPKFNQDQILVQRIPLLMNLIREANRQEIPINLNMIIGDTDFLTYYYPVIEINNLEADLEKYIQNVTTYRDSLVCILRETFTRNGISVDICDYGDQNVANLGLDETNIQKSSINVISLMLNTSTWETEQIDPTRIDFKDIEEESFYTSRRCNSKRFDSTIFAENDITVYEQMARIKVNEYRKQGRMVSELGGKIILMDELPPALKTRFFTNQSDLLFIFPWIRNEDAWRTQDLNELEVVNKVKKTIKG
jgi:hypothetical protein